MIAQQGLGPFENIYRINEIIVNNKWVQALRPKNQEKLKEFLTEFETVITHFVNAYGKDFYDLVLNLRSLRPIQLTELSTKLMNELDNYMNVTNRDPRMDSWLMNDPIGRLKIKTVLVDHKIKRQRHNGVTDMGADLKELIDIVKGCKRPVADYTRHFIEIIKKMNVILKDHIEKTANKPIPPEYNDALGDPTADEEFDAYFMSDTSSGSRAESHSRGSVGSTSRSRGPARPTPPPPKRQSTADSTHFVPRRPISFHEYMLADPGYNPMDSFYFAGGTPSPSPTISEKSKVSSTKSLPHSTDDQSVSYQSTNQRIEFKLTTEEFEKQFKIITNAKTTFKHHWLKSKSKDEKTPKWFDIWQNVSHIVESWFRNIFAHINDLAKLKKHFQSKCKSSAVVERVLKSFDRMDGEMKWWLEVLWHFYHGIDVEILTKALNERTEAIHDTGLSSIAKLIIDKNPIENVLEVNEFFRVLEYDLKKSEQRINSKDFEIVGDVLLHHIHMSEKNIRIVQYFIYYQNKFIMYCNKDLDPDNEYSRTFQMLYRPSMELEVDILIG